MKIPNPGKMLVDFMGDTLKFVEDNFVLICIVGGVLVFVGFILTMKTLIFG